MAKYRIGKIVNHELVIAPEGTAEGGEWTRIRESRGRHTGRDGAVYDFGRWAVIDGVIVPVYRRVRDSNVDNTGEK